MAVQTPRFSRKDVMEIIVGSATLALPVALSEEAWTVGAELPVFNLVFMVTISYSLIGAFVHSYHYDGTLAARGGDFTRRVLSVYLLTLVVSACCLLAFDRFPLLSEPVVALKRMVLVSLPASFFATVVDGLG